MSWDEVEGKWKQQRGKRRKRWDDWTDDGSLDQRRARLNSHQYDPESYGMNRQASERALEAWFRPQKD